ncbi:peptidyl-tRNA hydrolase ICT1, mitochondrial-like isoform X2 [Varroa jacobsoni]|uniref:Large ribosomal subunit protein mL62 n=1 Tax=Varroa destructor TaxID=109461 RepID=A0A7M7K9B0_VARDE|nr:peptidyl-tRNA hydrolase ICT1, mitochondrial-like isoform X1 [Varroa destructor]XP_022707630.1 peptidyl-tRNA hydrolase ICT1, mitochondrial-like isoform X2 [Varroa jacobsoni]
MAHCLRHVLGVLFKRTSLTGVREASFKSPLNIENLYGAGPEAIADSPQPPQSTESTFSGFIPMKELSVTYSRSSGPGGQHVNTTNSKVHIRFHIDSATWIPNNAKKRLKTQCASSITKDGFFVISSDRTRKQILNTADCVDRIRTMVFEACKPPPEVSQETRQMLKARLDRAAAIRLRQKRIKSQNRRNSQADHGF